MRLPNISKGFDDNGVPADKPGSDKRASGFLKDLLWMIESKKRMST